MYVCVGGGRGSVSRLFLAVERQLSTKGRGDSEEGRVTLVGPPTLCCTSFWR